MPWRLGEARKSYFREVYNLNCYIFFTLPPRKIGNKIIRRMISKRRKGIKTQWESHWTWFEKVALSSCLRPQGRQLYWKPQILP